MRFLALLGLALAPAVPAQHVNVALGGTPTQSTYAGYGETPGRAIDGNRDGNWFNGSTTCTASSPGSYWEVVLLSPSLVHEVVVWNRADCCPTRLANFRVDLKNGSAVVHQQTVFGGGGHPGAGRAVRVVVPGGVTATSVRLTNVGLNAEGNHFLQFSEVEVLRHGAGREVNFARFGTATASAAALGNPTRLVDGNTDGFAPNQSVFATPGSGAQWLQVACSRHRVDRIVLWPVTTGAPFATGNFRVAVLDQGVEVWGTNVLPVTTLPLTSFTSVTPPPGTFGDTIRLSTLGPNATGAQGLCLAELESLSFGNDLGTSEPYGSGCAPYPLAVPELQALSRPRLGAAVTLRTTGVPAQPGFGFHVVGLTDAAWGALPLPASLQPFGAPGCTALVRPDSSQLLLAAQGTLQTSLAVPNQPALLGAGLFHQAAVAAPAANPLGLLFSQALAMRIGN